LEWPDDLTIWGVVIDTVTGQQWSVLQLLAGYERPQLDVYAAASELGIGVPQLRRLRDDAVSALRQPSVLPALGATPSAPDAGAHGASPQPDTARCTAVTARGTRCGNPAVRPSRLCEQHKQAALVPCAAQRVDGGTCGNPRLQGFSYCFAHFGADMPAWSSGPPGEAKLLSVPRMPAGLLKRVWSPEASTDATVRGRLEARLGRLDPEDAEKVHDLVTDAISKRQYAIALRAIGAMRPSEYWPARSVRWFFDTPSHWRHATAQFASEAGTIILDSPEDQWGQRSSALGHLGAYCLVAGRPAAAKTYWEAAPSVRELDDAIFALAREVMWVSERAKTSVEHLARIVRTVEVRQTILSRLGHRPSRASPQ
jgi:hypothetical protein